MMLTWDIETKGLGGEFVIGGVYDGTTYNSFTNFKDLLDSLPEESCTIYAHNAGKYDNRYLIEFIRKHKIKITRMLFIHNGIVFRIKYNNVNYEFRDSIHLMQSSLKSLCKDFDIGDKSKKDFDMKKWEKEGYPITEELKTYLMYDCISLYELMDKFKTVFDVPIKMTIASTAFNVLLNTTYKGVKLEDLCKNVLTKEQEENIRLAFKGGRVEVFKRRGQDLYKYDVNSLYPAVMHDNYYPFGKMKEYKDKDKIEKLIDKGFLGILKVKVNAPNIKYPYLAKRHDTKLMFGYGEWEDWITSIEYVEAKKRGYKFDIELAYVWSKKGKIFVEFEEQYYKIKQTSKGAKKQVAKFFLNTCFGKFGQHREQRRLLREEEINDNNVDEVEMLDNEGFIYSIDNLSYGDRRINPTYAAFITAYARHELYLGFENIINKGGEIYYCDTDCIVCDKPMDDEYIDSDKLGYWDDEGNGKTFEDSIFISPKLYTMKQGKELTVKGKGFDREKLKEKKFKDFEDILNGKEDEIPTKRVTGIFEHFKRRDTDKNKFIQEIEIKKVMKNKYDKRKLLEDGINTIPQNLNEFGDE